jgi:hypothetical protein
MTPSIGIWLVYITHLRYQLTYILAKITQTGENQQYLAHDPPLKNSNIATLIFKDFVLPIVDPGSAPTDSIEMDVYERPMMAFQLLELSCLSSRIHGFNFMKMNS